MEKHCFLRPSRRQRTITFVALHENHRLPSSYALLVLKVDKMASSPLSVLLHDRRSDSPESEYDVFISAPSSPGSLTPTGEVVFRTAPSSPRGVSPLALASLIEPCSTPASAKKRVSFDLPTMHDPFVDKSSSPCRIDDDTHSGNVTPAQTDQKSPISPWPSQASNIRRTPQPGAIDSDWPREPRPPRLVRGYEPIPPEKNPPSQLDSRSNSFLKSQRFVMMCQVAIQQAHLLPACPPPLDFIAVDKTPMHQWYESLVSTFTGCFAKRLRDRDAYPQKPATYKAGGTIRVEDDDEAFNAELVAHIRAVFHSFNISWAFRPLGSTANLVIDVTQAHAGIAAMALKDTLEPPAYPPKADWKAGEPLHHYYRNILRRFRGGILRLLEEREDCRWILAHVEQLERGLAGYQEFYIRSMRRVWEERERSGIEANRGAAREMGGNMQIWEWQ